jgi:hypothetical protein
MVKTMSKTDKPIELFPVTGFPFVAFTSSGYVWMGEIENLFLPKNIVEVLESLKTLGLFNKKEKDIILVNSESLTNSTLQAFTIANGEKDDAISLLDVFNSSRPRANQTQPTLYSHGIKDVDNVTVEEFIILAKNRFAEHTFTLKNGWNFMYHLDLITDWNYSWSEEDIKLLAEYDDKGLPMNLVAELFDRGIAIKDMFHAIGMPSSWVKQMYGV